MIKHKPLFTSEAVTRGVRVHVVCKYSPDHSQPQVNRWFFLYTVKIANEGTEPVQLVSRHWIIEDAEGNVEEVRGPGVVGQQPELAPGESFQYTSGCPLTTPFGSMRGTYQMMSKGGATPCFRHATHDVKRISNQRVTGCRQVDTDLMGSSGFQQDLDQGRVAGPPERSNPTQ